MTTVINMVENTIVNMVAKTIENQHGGIWCQSCKNRSLYSDQCNQCGNLYCFECCGYAEEDENKGTRCSKCNGYKCFKHDYSREGVCGECRRINNEGYDINPLLELGFNKY